MTTLIPAGEPRLSRDAGLTLIELLVALALLALMMVALPGSLQLANRAWRTSAELTARPHDEATLRFVEQRLSEALPLQETNAEGARVMAFLGTATSLAFVAPLADGPAGGGLYRFEIAASVLEEGSIRQPRLRITRFREAGLPAGAATPTEERHLVSQPVSLALRYFGTPPGEDTALWTTEWRHADKLPDAVEFSFPDLNPAAAIAPPRRVSLKLGRRS